MKTILVVDDEPSMRGMLEDALSGAYQVTCVEDGLKACAMLNEASYDLVITDLVMPGMNGIDLLMGMSKTRPGQKVIAISGGGGINGRFDYLPVAQLVGACTILRKPFQLSELRAAVRALIG